MGTKWAEVDNQIIMYSQEYNLAKRVLKIDLDC